MDIGIPYYEDRTRMSNSNIGMEEKYFLSVEELISLLPHHTIVETDLTGNHGELVAIDVEKQQIKVKYKVDTGLYSYYYAQISDGVTLYEENGD